MVKRDRRRNEKEGGREEWKEREGRKGGKREGKGRKGKEREGEIERRREEGSHICQCVMQSRTETTSTRRRFTAPLTLS